MILSTSRPVLWTAAAAARATAGKVNVEWQASGVSIDSRTIEAGDLFVALQGPNHDGHAYVSDALKKAGAAMIHRDVPGLAGNAPLLRVADTMEGLRALGVAARARTSAKVIAVTGSVGKTGAKEALGFVLSGQAATHASVGSFNNHWGVPLSLARMPKKSVYGIFEMGMNHPGEIAPLSQMARPHVALITTIEAVHSEFFKTTEEIADAKAEIFTGVEPGGIAVLNRDNAFFERLADAAKANGIATIIGFGEHERADIRLLDAALEVDHSIVMADVFGMALTYRLGVPGRHWVMNSLGVLGAAHAAGADVQRAGAALAGLSPPKGRGQVHRIALPGGELTVIDESYNASPVSVKAALAVLGRLRPAPGGRRIAVLGDMLELGPRAATKHKCLLTPILENDVDLVFTAGTDMANLAEALPRPQSGGHAGDSKALAPLVLQAVRAGDIVTVKGSAGSRMNVIVEALLACASEDAASAPRVVNGE
ncbi:MAG: UDP-N-acetylmuramoylalanyl-D-glutamyl-2,6-diaminopimelate--D-alanyl-D-alanine ligase [Rhodospirillales bacterium]